MIQVVKNRNGSLLLDIVTVILLVMTLACSARPSTQQSSSNQSRDTLPAVNLPEGQGVIDNCSMAEDPHCTDRLRAMAAAGFTLVVNYNQLNATSGQELAYAEVAQQLGMKIIWAINDPSFWNGNNLLHVYSHLGFTCGCSDNNGFIHYVVNLVRNLPATWGYLVGEEVMQTDHDRMKAYADLIKQLDPHHPRLAISSEYANAPGAHIKPFIDTADVIGSSVYPIGNLEPISTVGAVAHALQLSGDEKGKSVVLVLQAFSMAQYKACSPAPGCARFPTVADMREMLDLSLRNSHPRFILWFSYFDILRSDNPSAYWKRLVEAAGVNQMSPTSW